VRVQFAGCLVPVDPGQRMGWPAQGCPRVRISAAAPEQIPRFPRDLFWREQFHEGAVMGGLYFGIAVTGVNALVATGLVIALM